MAKKFLYTALAGVSLILSGCSEDLVSESTQATEKHFGEEILFGGSASYNVNGGTKNGTRTVYGGYENITDGTEPVYWTQGDAVRVYCPEGANNTADYDVDVTGEKVITTSLSRRGESALQWGNPNSKHTFYGVYPIPADEGLKNEATITGTIPATQTGTYEKKNYDHIFHPNMEYAYMVAKTVVENPNNIGNSVYMKFTPIATAVEISLQNNTGQQLDIKSVTCYSEETNIAGKFTADLSAMSTPSNSSVCYGTTEGLIISNGTGTLSSKIDVSLQQNGQPVSLAIGETVIFTVFMLPTAEVNDLNILVDAVSAGEEGYKNGKLNGVTIKKQKKTYLRNLSISSRPFSYEDWISFLENTSVLNKLSIPAAGGAASGDVNHNGSYDLADESRQQNLCVTDLWNAGIRCFEFATDIYKESGQTTVVSSLGDAPVVCNGLSCGYSLDQAITDVVNELNEAPNEFAMIILTYQTLGGWDERNPIKYAELLDDYWTNVVAKKLKDPCALGKYTSSITVGDARGKLFCIARPTSIYQDYGTVTAFTGDQYNGFDKIEQVASTKVEHSKVKYDFKNQYIVQIHGWGALKDKWQQRGYTAEQQRLGSGTNTNRPFDVATLSDKLNLGHTERSIKNENWINGETWYGNLPNVEWKSETLTPDFKYETSIDDTEAWIQEYARVSRMGTAITDILAIERKKCPEYDPDAWFNKHDHDEIKAIWWAPTKQEKIGNIQACIQKALGNTGNTIYINSLCGYYIDTRFYESYMPCILTDWNSNGNKLTVASKTAGMQGNIGDFAKDMNEEFYAYLAELTKNGPVAGSMGIIMMDRVGENEASKRIPQIIIANNFKFELNSDIEIPEGGEIKQGDEILSRKNTRSIELSEEPTIIWE